MTVRQSWAFIFVNRISVQRHRIHPSSFWPELLRLRRRRREFGLHGSWAQSCSTKKLSTVMVRPTIQIPTYPIYMTMMCCPGLWLPRIHSHILSAEASFLGGVVRLTMNDSSWKNGEFQWMAFTYRRQLFILPSCGITKRTCGIVRRFWPWFLKALNCLESCIYHDKKLRLINHAVLIFFFFFIFFPWGLESCNPSFKQIQPHQWVMSSTVGPPFLCPFPPLLGSPRPARDYTEPLKSKTRSSADPSLYLSSQCPSFPGCELRSPNP